MPDEFAQLRTALKPYVGGNLNRVVFVSYANPAMQAENKPCPGGRDGLDVHPAFGADAERLRAAAEFVDTKFLPRDQERSRPAMATRFAAMPRPSA